MCGSLANMNGMNMLGMGMGNMGGSLGLGGPALGLDSTNQVPLVTDTYGRVFLHQRIQSNE